MGGRTTSTDVVVINLTERKTKMERDDDDLTVFLIFFCVQLLSLSFLKNLGSSSTEPGDHHFSTKPPPIPFFLSVLS